MDEFLTVADIAAILRLNQQTIRNWIDEGKLPAVHIGRRVRVRREDFVALTQERYTGRRRSPVTVLTAQAQAFWDGDLQPLPECAAPAGGGID